MNDDDGKLDSVHADRFVRRIDSDEVFVAAELSRDRGRPERKRFVGDHDHAGIRYSPKSLATRFE